MYFIKNEDLTTEDLGNYKMINAMENITNGKKVKIGKAIFNPGSRVPKEGFAFHDMDEYSFILKEQLNIATKDGRVLSLNEGDISYLPKFEDHWSSNETDCYCEGIWILVD